MSPLALLLVLLPSLTVAQKRGLIYISSETAATDAALLLSSPNTQTWYYNYSPTPSANIPVDIEFVPMLWGADGSEDFAKTVLSLSPRPKYILALNEPDMERSVGGCDVDPDTAAQVWIDDVEQLKEEGVMVGAPAVSGSPGGMQWLKGFFAACDGKCGVGFLPVHWYGSFEGMASWIGEVRATWPELDLWVTEFGFPEVGLEETQGFFNTSIEYLERLEYVERYSWFGSFRADDSNVGPNAAMLDGEGRLTDVGAWYLGRPATGVLPSVAWRVGTMTEIVVGWAVAVAVFLGSL